MMKYLKWILSGIVAVAAVAALIAGFMYIHKTDTYTVKVVAIENSLNEIGRSLEGVTGVKYVPIEIPQQYQDAVRTPKQRAESTPQPTDAAQTPAPEATEQPSAQENNTTAATPVPTRVPSATTAPRATAAPRATSVPSSNTNSTPQPAGTAEPTARPTAVPAATEAPGVTPVPTDPTPTPDGGESGGTGEETHVHTWVTETIPEQGYTDYVTVEDVEYITITDEPEYYDDEGNYYPAVTHQEAVTTQRTEEVYVVVVPASTRTYCSGCGATA